MARVGVEKLLGRLLGVKGPRVRGARFEPRGVGVEVLPPRRRARCSRLKPSVRLSKTVRRHQQGIVAYTQAGLSNGVVEGLDDTIRRYP